MLANIACHFHANTYSSRAVRSCHSTSTQGKILQKISHRVHTGDFGDWILFWVVGDEVINQVFYKAVNPYAMFLEFPSDK